MSRTFRSFSLTRLPPDVDPGVRESFQAMAQAIDQLTDAVNGITFARGVANQAIINGDKAGNFDGVFLQGRITTAGLQQRFFHKLNRLAIGVLEVLTIPNVDQPGGAVLNVAGAIAVAQIPDQESIILISTVNLRVFTLLVF